MYIRIDKKGFVFIAVILLIIIIVASFFVQIDIPVIPGTESPTGGFHSINATYAHKLVKQSSDLTIVDCSQSKDEYKKGNHIPRATWTPNPSLFYQYRTNVMVYADNDDVARQFCVDLVKSGKFFGTLYCMEGGYQAWVDTG